MKKILKFIFFLVLLIAVCLITGNIYLKNTYGINAIDIYKQVKQLNVPVEEEKLCDNRFTKEDISNCKDVINNAANTTIVIEKDGNISFDFTNINQNIKEMIKLSDKECAAIADSVLKEQYAGKLKLGDVELPSEILQIKFSNIENGNSNINLIAKVDFKEIKKEFNKFPLNLVAKYIPESLYISSTTFLEKSTTAFDYSLTSVDFMVNNLSNEDSSNLFTTINKIVNIGTVDDFNLLIGNTICDALIGNENNQGLAYNLKDYGAKDFKFVKENDNAYFVIERKTFF